MNQIVPTVGYIQLKCNYLHIEYILLYVLSYFKGYTIAYYKHFPELYIKG